MMPEFHLVSEEDIRSGKTTDIYFENIMEIFNKKGVGNENVVAEFTASSLPDEWRWGVFAGLDEVLCLLEGKNVDIYALPEGTVFRHQDTEGVNTPVMFIEGSYKKFCIYETPILGLICHPSGVATKSARVKKAAKSCDVMSFGIRRMHPGIAPVIDRAAYIGGCDSVSCIAGAEEVGIEPKGTMPHALSIIFGDPKKAYKAFDDVLSKDIARIALVDTYYDETIESFMAAEAMGENLYGIRLDTPTSRRGNLKKIAQEIKWELKCRGVDARIIASGGINEYTIPELRKAGVDGFGVGTTISNADTIDFSMDIVEMDGKPSAKRGKFSEKKQAYRCPECMTYKTKLWNKEDIPVCKCGNKMVPMLQKFMENGKILDDYPSALDLKTNVTNQLQKLEADWFND
ncbi:nicotinate phosphoribosyltransferase [Methanohalobium evestigatum]|nr:nicotinate phosphoribosyltransferase [Methanohalobium evestigatum]